MIPLLQFLGWRVGKRAAPSTCPSDPPRGEVGWELCAVDALGPALLRSLGGGFLPGPWMSRAHAPARFLSPPGGSHNRNSLGCHSRKGFQSPRGSQMIWGLKVRPSEASCGAALCCLNPCQGDPEKRVVTIRPVLHRHDLVRTGRKASMIIPILQLRKRRLRDRK